MSLYYGVDSQTRTTFTIPARRVPAPYRPRAGEPLSFFAYISARLREARPASVAEADVPAFWGRYLNSSDDADLGALNRDEAERIFAMSDGHCRILPVYNGSWRRESMVTGPHARNNGRNAAEHAIALASSGDLAIPPTVRLYADLERWRVDREWFLGWMEAMLVSAYPGVGGFYGHPSVWGAARRPEGGRDYDGWGRNIVPVAERFADQRFSALMASLSGQPGAIMPQATTARVWANRPYLNNPGHEMSRDALFQRQFRAQVTPASAMTESVIWQYGANIPFELNGLATIDMNLAKAAAYDEMWAGG